MKRFLASATWATALFATGLSNAQSATKLDGRWDLTITIAGDHYPSWMEVKTGGATPEVRVVSRVASVHPAKNVRLVGNALTFQSSEYFGKTVDVDWEVKLSGDKLVGVQKRSDAVTGRIAGSRAPALDAPVPKEWNAPEPIFNGRDLTGWEKLYTEPGKDPESHWEVENRELINRKPGANIRTKRTFQDFKLHVEFNCPQDGNSGVYLRGRYEVQVEYEPKGTNDESHGMGAIYGFLAPARKLPPRPGQWETIDITLVGRRVTVVRNGETTIDNQEIPGITGGAIDSREGEPGPIYIQGDHTAGMRYRNIQISTPKRGAS